MERRYATQPSFLLVKEAGKPQLKKIMVEAAVPAERLTSPVCPYCGATGSEEHFCSECGKILPLAGDLDYFKVFGLARKLQLDEVALENDFYALSRRLHPDYFMNATALERQASVDRSSKLNDAYRTLRDRVSRISYLLWLEGYKESEKKAPPELLEEVFELNMTIEELRGAKRVGDLDEVSEARLSLNEALAGLQRKLTDIDGRLAELAEQWDANLERENDRDPKKSLLDRVSDLLSHRSYVQHLVKVIQEEL